MPWVQIIDWGEFPLCAISEKRGGYEFPPEFTLRFCDLVLSGPRLDVNCLVRSTFAVEVVVAYYVLSVVV